MAGKPRIHEDYGRAHEVKMGSERGFGLVFAAVFAVIGLWPLVAGAAPRLWPLGIALAFLAVALAKPGLLKPFNRLWFGFGLLLGRVVNPIVMALLFCVAVTPVGLIMRAMGKDPLRLKLARDAESYWIVREPPGPKPETMRQQF